MNIQAEVSLYPLRTLEIGGAINDFVDELSRAGLTVREGDMSTVLSGGVGEVFAAVEKAFSKAADADNVVLILKASNACPSSGAVNGKKTDV